MAITTDPVFYYIDPVTVNNRFVDFDEGSGSISVELNPSSYAITELMTECARAMNTIGIQVYTITFDRVTRFVTISSIANFSLNVTTGSNVGLDVYPLLGFTTERSGANSYVSDVAIGTEYLPQFPLQTYRPFIDNERGISPSINESGSGVIEVVTFGRRSFMEFNIKYIKDGQPCSDSIYGNDPNAVQNVRDFLSFCIGKGRLEFMEDKQNRPVFDIVLLESTASDSKGTSYRIKELLAQGLLGYYETGKLKFRQVEV